jgi:hypothetical protein
MLDERNCDNVNGKPPEGRLAVHNVGKPNPTRFRVTAQGGLIKVSSLQSQNRGKEQRKKSRRGKVAGMSAKSRKRLLELVTTLASARMLIFITVTYRTAPSSQDAKRHLHAFLQRIYRRAPMSAVIWKMETQERGAIHFHLLCFNLPFWRKKQVQSAWGEITGEEKPFTRIEAIRARKKAFAYVAKYMAKSVKSGFNYAPYPNEASGRTWGIRQKENLVFEEKRTWDYHPVLYKRGWRALALAAYIELRDKAEKEYPPIAHYEQIGFTLFVENAFDWLAGLTVTDLRSKLLTSF